MSDDNSPFHRGEKAIQSRLGIEEKIDKVGREIIADHISSEDQEHFSRIQLLIVSTADTTGRPWASVLAGHLGFVDAVNKQTLRVGARPTYGDPLNKSLVDGADIGSLGLAFDTRRRIRVNGTVCRVGDGSFDIQVAQTFPNCLKLHSGP